jgi:O-antigen/teichoic acid export membrane protein
MSILALLVFASITYTLIPGATRSSRFSISALQTVWRFAGGMIGITFLSLLLTQVDKILLSKLLSLKDFGYYTLAATVAGTIYMIIMPVTQAIYPRLCELQVANNFRRLHVVYHKSAQLVTTFAGSAALVIIVFSQSFLQLWTQNVELSKHVAPLLSLLMIGNLLNGLMIIPYEAQLAFGWTSLSIRINCLAVALIVPAILWATPRFGAVGAALAWVTLNIGYLAFGIHYMHKKILIGEKMSWYFNDLAFPLVSGLSVALAIRYSGFASGSTLDIIVGLLLASILVFAAALLSAD